MALESDPVARLFAQVLALRLVVQDILGRQAADAADFNGFLDRVHAGVQDDLTRVQLSGHSPEVDQAILMFAGAAIDEIFAPVRKGPAPPP